MPKKVDWPSVRFDYEVVGMSKAALGRKYKISVTAITNHQKAEGWVKPSDQEPAPQVEAESPAEAVREAFTEQTVKIDDLPGVGYQQQIAELEAKLEEERNLRFQAQVEASKARDEAAEYEAEAVANRPYREVNLYTDPDTVRVFYGEDKMTELAELKLGEVNKARLKAGQLPYDFSKDPDMMEKTIMEIAQELVSRRTRFADENPNIRVVKMWHNERAVQVPVEWQVNNEAGQQGTALWKMRDKGAKLIEPYLCQRNNCWREAILEDGKVKHGYCSASHYAGDPYLTDVSPGVTRSTQGTRFASEFSNPIARGL